MVGGVKRGVCINNVPNPVLCFTALVMVCPRRWARPTLLAINASQLFNIWVVMSQLIFSFAPSHMYISSLYIYIISSENVMESLFSLSLSLFTFQMVITIVSMYYMCMYVVGHNGLVVGEALSWGQTDMLLTPCIMCSDLFLNYF